MNRARKSGILVLICGIAMYLIFSDEISGIAGAVITGLGIGMALIGQFGKN